MAFRILLLGSLLLAALPIRAQDTFSIVAIDTLTGEIASAGASCIENSYIITHVLPGVGAVHTQSYWDVYNQKQTSEWLAAGYTAQMILDSTYALDATEEPEIRQYGAITLQGPNRSAAFTGAACFDVKYHKVGPTYSIQGNILKGREVIDSMESRFLNTSGPLHDRVMAAMQGANSVGADSRCAPKGVSSLSAFIRLARSTDDPADLWLDINIPRVPAGMEPIDSLQKRFDAWKQLLITTQRVTISSSPLFYPNPVRTSTRIRLPLMDLNGVTCILIDPLGNRTEVFPEQEGNELILLRGNLPAGTYRSQIVRGASVLVETSLVVE